MFISFGTFLKTNALQHFWFGDVKNRIYCEHLDVQKCAAEIEIDS